MTCVYCIQLKAFILHCYSYPEVASIHNLYKMNSFICNVIGPILLIMSAVACCYFFQNSAVRYAYAVGLLPKCRNASSNNTL